MLCSNCGQRISIVGTTGSGKTTLACQLSQLLAIPHVELDALHWEPNWTEANTDVFRSRTQKALNINSWVVDGNYSAVRDIVWSQADTVVWLDYTLAVIMRRLLWRTWRRSTTQEELWNGNRESLKKALSHDSIIRWALQTYRKNRKMYPILFKQPEHAHLEVVHLRSPQATRDWLSLKTPLSKSK